MTATSVEPHVLIADCLYFAAAVLFLVKFVTWEEAKHQSKQKRILVSVSTTLCTLLVTGLLIFSNHRLNRQKLATQPVRGGPGNCSAGQTGDATATGDGNIANTGNCNDINSEKKKLK